MNVNTAVGLLANPNNARLHTNFILKLNATDRNNFMKASTNKKNWIRKWIRDKHGYTNAEIQALVNKIPVEKKVNTFRRYVNALINSINNNMRVVEHMNPREPPPYVNLQMKPRKGPFKGYIQLEPACKNNHNKGVYIHYGTTFNTYRGAEHKNARGKGIGYRLREAARNAALKSKIRLYQVSQNLEGLVAPGALPISGKIMQSLGAHRLNYPPPCRSSNVRGPQNYVFLVGNKPLKRPLTKPGPAKAPRTLSKRTR
jgi:GNAT superfamily N-acetyltransferase